VSGVVSRRIGSVTRMRSSLPVRASLNIIHRQLPHANLGTASIHLEGIETEEIIATVQKTTGADDAGKRRALTA
jgi:hypothetical protein